MSLMLADKFYLGEVEGVGAKGVGAKRGSGRSRGEVYSGDAGSRCSEMAWTFRDIPCNYAADPTGWFISEKLDGVRALWNGKNFISRGKKVFHAPDWFKEQMPKDCVLDGELHCGRGQFQLVSGITRHKVPVDEDWKKVRFCVFDAPEIDGGFEERMNVYMRVVAEAGGEAGGEAGSVLEAATQTRIEHFEHAYEMYKSWVMNGAEGAMLREPNSPYEKKRSKYLLKWKPVHDAEAVVIGYQQGKNRLAGKLGTFTVEMDGKTFSLSGCLSDVFRNKYVFRSGGELVEGPDEDDDVYPTIGDVVTFTFMEYTTNGLPRQPVFQRIRYKKNQTHRA